VALNYRVKKYDLLINWNQALEIVQYRESMNPPDFANSLDNMKYSLILLCEIRGKNISVY